jgi:hypothetical protein
VRVSDGPPVDFDGLVIAMGLTPRSLPGGDLAGVHVLRTLDDALALRAALLAGPRVVVVGTGFLGDPPGGRPAAPPVRDAFDAHGADMLFVSGGWHSRTASR